MGKKTPQTKRPVVPERNEEHHTERRTHRSHSTHNMNYYCTMPYRTSPTRHTTRHTTRHATPLLPLLEERLQDFALTRVTRYILCVDVWLHSYFMARKNGNWPDDVSTDPPLLPPWAQWRVARYPILSATPRPRPASWSISTCRRAGPLGMRDCCLHLDA